MSETGHNVGDDALTVELEALKEQCSRFDGEVINEDNAPRVRDILSSAKRLRDMYEDARTLEKRPHIDAGREIDERYKELQADLADLVVPFRDALTAFLQEQKRRQQEEADRVRREAEAARKAAEEASRAAENPFAKADAAEAAEVAAKQEKAAERAAAARPAVTGYQRGRAATLRTFWSVEITDKRALVTHYADHPDVVEAARKVAAAESRSKAGQIDIPGVRAVSDERVA